MVKLRAAGTAENLRVRTDAALGAERTRMARNCMMWSLTT